MFDELQVDRLLLEWSLKNRGSHPCALRQTESPVSFLWYIQYTTEDKRAQMSSRDHSWINNSIFYLSFVVNQLFIMNGGLSRVCQHNWWWWVLASIKMDGIRGHLSIKESWIPRGESIVGPHHRCNWRHKQLSSSSRTKHNSLIDRSSSWLLKSPPRIIILSIWTESLK